MSGQLGWLLLALGLVAAATVGLCLHDLAASEWLAVVGPAGVLAGAGVHLSAPASPPVPPPVSPGAQVPKG